MENLPHLPILLLTYRRLSLSLRTIESTVRNLGYPKELISYYVCDDGSPEEEHAEVLKCLTDLNQNILGEHNKRVRAEGQEDTFYAGKSYNLGLGLCHQKSDFVLILENDWELEKPLDLVPHIRLLQEEEVVWNNQEKDVVGAVSFRILSAGADVHTIGWNGTMYLKYLRTTQYAFSGNPYIRHARFTKRYGWFAEDRNPGNMETHQDDQYRLATEKDAPVICRPADISIWGSWSHIGQEKSWN